MPPWHGAVLPCQYYCITIRAKDPVVLFNGEDSKDLSGYLQCLQGLFCVNLARQLKSETGVKELRGQKLP